MGRDLGGKIVETFWAILDDDIVQLNKLNEHPETKKLKPWRGAFETGNSLGIMNYPTNSFDLVREGKIKVVIDEIDQLGDEKVVYLKGGQKLSVDAIVCGTGWKIGGSVKFKPESLRAQLGLPTTQLQVIEGEALIRMVEYELYDRFPYLKARPTTRIHHYNPALRHTPTPPPTQQLYRLYRFLVPPSYLQDRTIGFAGALMSLGSAPCAHLQSLWLTAYLDGTLPLPSISSEWIKYETYRDTQYCTLRKAAGYGNMCPDLVFDSLPYFDALLRDLGLEGKRKGTVLGYRNWLAESFRSHGPEDYVGLVEEWKRRVQVNGAGKDL